MKKPLPIFIEDIYLKRFGRDRPADVKSVEEVFKAKEKKKNNDRKKNSKKRLIRRIEKQTHLPR